MVTDSSGEALPHIDIFAALKQICDVAPRETPPIGILTTMQRDEWASVRARMDNNFINSVALADIDKALFVVCLEDETHEGHTAVCRNFLHGNGRNRWYVDWRRI